MPAFEIKTKGWLDNSKVIAFKQGGVKEHISSTFVRLYQVMDMRVVTGNLDLYKGMPHVFQ